MWKKHILISLLTCDVIDKLLSNVTPRLRTLMDGLIVVPEMIMGVIGQWWRRRGEPSQMTSVLTYFIWLWFIYLTVISNNDDIFCYWLIINLIWAEKFIWNSREVSPQRAEMLASAIQSMTNPCSAQSWARAASMLQIGTFEPLVLHTSFMQ